MEVKQPGTQAHSSFQKSHMALTRLRFRRPFRRKILTLYRRLGRGPFIADHTRCSETPRFGGDFPQGLEKENPRKPHNNVDKHPTPRWQRKTGINPASRALG